MFQKFREISRIFQKNLFKITGYSRLFFPEFSNSSVIHPKQRTLQRGTSGKERSGRTLVFNSRYFYLIENLLTALSPDGFQPCGSSTRKIWLRKADVVRKAFVLHYCLTSFSVLS